VDNGDGWQFSQKRSPEDPFFLVLEPNKVSLGTMNTSSLCQLTLEYLWHNFKNSAFTSPRTAEIIGCLNASKKVNWDNYMAHFYCQLPLDPIRKCFTLGAQALKQQGYTQENAYRAMYQTCLSNGSFDSMSEINRLNFDVVMVSRGSDLVCKGQPAEIGIDAFYRGLGLQRGIR
jgi:hypothetical protein